MSGECRETLSSIYAQHRFQLLEMARDTLPVDVDGDRRCCSTAAGHCRTQAALPPHYCGLSLFALSWGEKSRRWPPRDGER